MGDMVYIVRYCYKYSDEPIGEVMVVADGEMHAEDLAREREGWEHKEDYYCYAESLLDILREKGTI